MYKILMRSPEEQKSEAEASNNQPTAEDFERACRFAALALARGVNKAPNTGTGKAMLLISMEMMARARNQGSIRKAEN